jgi:hypothetical protein
VHQQFQLQPRQFAERRLVARPVGARRRHRLLRLLRRCAGTNSGPPCSRPEGRRRTHRRTHRPRSGCAALVHPVCTLGYWSPFFDSDRRQGWHDKAANAVVIPADAPTPV